MKVFEAINLVYNVDYTAKDYAEKMDSGNFCDKWDEFGVDLPVKNQERHRILHNKIMTDVKCQGLHCCSCTERMLEKEVNLETNLY